MTLKEPSIQRRVTLNFVGDWGQANFHRICAWLCQEFCDRAGPGSSVTIANLRDGGLDGIRRLQLGEVDLCVATPVMLLGQMPAGEGFFSSIGPFPQVRALATLPQNDSMALAIHPRFGITSFADLRAKRPPLRIAASADDGTNLIGHVTRLYMEAHGIDRDMLKSWGGDYVFTTRPEQSLFKMADGEVDAVVQEAIMTPWWTKVAATALPLPAEETALALLAENYGFRRNRLPPGYWDGLETALPTLDFSDFSILVRADMADDIAHLLSWCLVETREAIERQYRHIPAERSPLSYPFSPRDMAKTPVKLHPGAKRYYSEAALLS